MYVNHPATTRGWMTPHWQYASVGATVTVTAIEVGTLV